MISEQVRELNRNYEEVKRGMVASNNRLTDAEGALLRVERKVDTLLSRPAELQSSNVPSLSRADGAVTMGGAFLAPVPRLESIPADLVIPEESLQQVVAKTNSGKHFASSILKFVWPELFGPDMRRLCYNWNGQRVKTPLDDRRKRVVELYTHFYYPETRHQKLWSDVVSHINERMRQKDGRKQIVPATQEARASYSSEDENRNPAASTESCILDEYGQADVSEDNLDNIPASVNLTSSFSYMD